MEPTSLNGGEGLLVDMREGEGEGGSGEVVEDGENEQNSTVMWLMSVSNSNLPRR